MHFGAEMQDRKINTEIMTISLVHTDNNYSSFFLGQTSTQPICDPIMHEGGVGDDGGHWHLLQIN